MKKLNEFNVGGLHSQNPNGGIPINNTNTVEQGESKYGSFIFSNRFNVSKDLIDQYKLPGYIKDKTFADASKLINNKFKDRVDKVSNETKEELLSRLSTAHEASKPQEQLDRSQMFMGGIAEDSTGIPGLQSGISGLTNLASGNKDEALTNGLSAAGSIGGTLLGGPIGGMIGGQLGTLGGQLINKGKEKDELRKLNKIKAIQNSSTYQNDFALGGPLDGTLSDDELTNSLANQYNGIPNFRLNSTPTVPEENYEPNLITRVGTPADLKNNIYPKADLKPIADWASNNYGNALRLAPLATNALQLAKLKKTPYERLNKLDSRYKTQYTDERTVQNIVGNDLDNTTNALTGAVNGSEGALRNNILGAGLNRSKAMSNAYMSIADRNNQQDSQAQQFNLGIDQVNLNQSNQELDINDRNSAAYDNAKSKLISQLGTDIGSIGKEEVYKKIAKQIYGYKWNGEYWVKPDGSKASDSEVKIEVNSQENKMKFGGFLKKY